MHGTAAAGSSGRDATFPGCGVGSRWRSTEPARWSNAIVLFSLLVVVGGEAANAGPAAQAAAARPLALDETPKAFTQVLGGLGRKAQGAHAASSCAGKAASYIAAASEAATPDGRYHLASLSKAVTGACIATLVRDGKLAYETPLAKALARFFTANGKPADARIERVTIAPAADPSRRLFQRAGR